MCNEASSGACWFDQRHVSRSLSLSQHIIACLCRHTRIGLASSPITLTGVRLQIKPCICTLLVRSVDARRDNKLSKQHAYHAAPARHSAAE